MWLQRYELLTAGRGCQDCGLPARSRTGDGSRPARKRSDRKTTIAENCPEGFLFAAAKITIATLMEAAILQETGEGGAGGDASNPGIKFTSILTMSQIDSAAT